MIERIVRRIMIGFDQHLGASFKENLSREVEHKEELQRLSGAHQAEVDALKAHINYLENLNERLLRVSGVDPLTTPVSAESKENPVLEHTASSISGSLIWRDKQRVLERETGRRFKNPEEFRVYLEQVANAQLAAQQAVDIPE